MITGKPFDLEIVTPSRIEFTGKVESVSVPGSYRPFQILYNHAPIVAELEIGEIHFNDSDDQDTIYASGGGFVQVLNNKVSIVVESAEEAGSIDIERALEAQQRAEDRLKRREEYDFKRSKLALARAINRLKIAGYKLRD